MDIDKAAKMAMDIDKLTVEEIDKFIEATPLVCKIDPKTGSINCDVGEDFMGAIARLKNPVKRVVFEVTSNPAAPEAPVNES